MNRKTFQPSLLLLAAVVMLASLLTSPAAAGGNPKASGHGNLIWGGELRTFSFTAVKHADGTVTGEAELNNRGVPIEIHMEIDCLKFEGGNRAIMSGPITHSSRPEFNLVGLIAVFGVEDNGEDNNALPDRIGGVDPPYSCNEVTFAKNKKGVLQDSLYLVGKGVKLINDPLTPIMGGNIQVEP